jgi:DNA-binding PadR family transcriptional regulator
MRRRPDQLTTGEWAVLAVVEEGPTHGFAVARALEPDGEVGRVWSMRRPLVYRTLDVLEDRELTQTAGTEPSTAGPQRTVIEVTAEGRETVRRWLLEPVEHVRDARSELLLKLLFLDRRGMASDELLDAQRERFREQERQLRGVLDASDGFTRTLALWRVENTAAAVRFVDALHS